MEENKIEKTIKTPSLGLAVLPLIFMFVVLFTGLIIFKHKLLSFYVYSS